MQIMRVTRVRLLPNGCEMGEHNGDVGKRGAMPEGRRVTDEEILIVHLHH